MRKGTHRTTPAGKAGGKQNAPERSSDDAEEDEDDGKEPSDVQAAGRVVPKPADPVVDKAAELDDDDARQSKEKDQRSVRQLFETTPDCSLGQEIYKCDENEQAEMMRSYLCLGKTTGNTCLEWRPQRQCLGAETNRFTSGQECESSCQDADKCAKAQTCDCTGLFRKANYVFDSVRKRCRLIPKIECVDRDVGFRDADSCRTACEGQEDGSEGSGAKDTRCSLGSLESVVRPCLWDDKRYTHYFDHKHKRCEPWDESACVSNAFPRLGECLSTCTSSYEVRSAKVAAVMAAAGNSTAEAATEAKAPPPSTAR